MIALKLKYKLRNKTTQWQDLKRQYCFGDWQPKEVEIVDTFYGDLWDRREKMEECGYDYIDAEELDDC
jgi:hypothetical protein